MFSLVRQSFARSVWIEVDETDEEKQENDSNQTGSRFLRTAETNVCILGVKTAAGRYTWLKKQHVRRRAQRDRRHIHQNENLPRRRGPIDAFEFSALRRNEAPAGEEDQ